MLIIDKYVDNRTFQILIIYLKENHSVSCFMLLTDIITNYTLYMFLCGIHTISHCVNNYRLRLYVKIDYKYKFKERTKSLLVNSKSHVS